MEIDQCLLESLPLGQRQRLVRRMRSDQLRAYYEREQAASKQLMHRSQSSQRKKRAVNFSQSNVIQDAIVRHDDKEGEVWGWGVVMFLVIWIYVEMNASQYETH